jgi:hypothetical protein
MFDRKSFLIGVLTISAAILTLGHLQLTSTARASESVIDDDYQLVTARTNQGNDGLYVLSKRENLVVLFTWDPAKKSIVPKDVKSLDAMLGGG